MHAWIVTLVWRLADGARDSVTARVAAASIDEVPEKLDDGLVPEGVDAEQVVMIEIRIKRADV